jgi:hypothetical protein
VRENPARSPVRKPGKSRRGKTVQQRVASHPRHHGVMDRRSTLDAAADPCVEALAGRKVASLPAGRRRTPPKRMKFDPFVTIRNRCATPHSGARRERAHFPSLRSRKTEAAVANVPAMKKPPALAAQAVLEFFRRSLRLFGGGP